uniref:Uncharacterized protein n=1 Tax=Zea mays TaxID=4577 RepID=A0A804QIQ4_MAIZE
MLVPSPLSSRDVPTVLHPHPTQCRCPGRGVSFLPCPTRVNQQARSSSPSAYGGRPCSTLPQECDSPRRTALSRGPRLALPPAPRRRGGVLPRPHLPDDPAAVHAATNRDDTVCTAKVNLSDEIDLEDYVCRPGYFCPALAKAFSIHFHNTNALIHSYNSDIEMFTMNLLADTSPRPRADFLTPPSHKIPMWQWRPATGAQRHRAACEPMLICDDEASSTDFSTPHPPSTRLQYPFLHRRSSIQFIYDDKASSSNHALLQVVRCHAHVRSRERKRRKGCGDRGCKMADSPATTRKERARDLQKPSEPRRRRRRLGGSLRR